LTERGVENDTSIHRGTQSHKENDDLLTVLLFTDLDEMKQSDIPLTYVKLNSPSPFFTNMWWGIMVMPYLLYE
jgi:hypothetical protein